jgi:hypothetical protein
MMHAAIHDALNAIDRRFEPYASDAQAPADASSEAAVAAAAHDVLMVLFGQIPDPPFPPAVASMALIEAAYDAALASIPDAPAKMEGIQAGHQAAAAILALRAGDGSDAPFPFAAGTGWGNVTPFVLNFSSQYHAQPPYLLTSKKYAADLNEVKSLGAANSTSRTAEQTEIALFWVESSVLGWNRIAQIVSAKHGLDLWENARLFALLNLASADGYIADFQNKYTYQFWRPITAIRAADTDDNPGTVADPTWESLRPTPAAPDYTSGHSVQGGAWSEVLARFFNTDDVSFSTTSTTLPGVTRSFTSFSQAAHENGDSRVYVGFHFRHAVEEGIKLGRQVGKVAVLHFLRPVH